MARPTAALFPSPGRPLGTRALGIAVVLAVVLVLLFATGALARARQFVGLGTPAPTYQTATITRGNLAVTVTATGPIAAARDLPLNFKASGKLATVKVAVGDKVARGQVLAALDTTDLQAALDQAKANLASAQANLARIQAGATAPQRDVAQVAVDNARAAAAEANASLAAVKQSSAKDVTAAQTSVHSANTAVASAQASLATAENQKKEGLAADQVAIANAEKNLSGVQATVAANLAVLQQQVEKAKDDLWAQQISRDAACRRATGNCDAANAQVAAAQTGLTTARAQLVQGQKQADQQVAQAQAQLATARAQLKSDQARYDAAVVSADNALKQAQASAATAAVGLSQAEAKATATVQSAQSQVTQTKGSVKTAENNYNQTVSPPTAPDLAAARAQVDSAKAAVQTAQNNLDAATLVAPFAGTVAAINGTPGQWISGGPTSNTGNAFLSLVSLEDLQVTAQVNEADIGKVKLGDKVTFNVNAYPDKTFSGQVIQIQPVGTTVQNVVNYNVTSTIQPLKDALLYPGMTATVSIVSQERTNVLRLPNSALSFGPTAIREGLVQFPRSNSQNGGEGPARGSSSPNRQTGGSGNARGGGFGAVGADAGQGLVTTLKDGKLTPVRVRLGITDGAFTEVLGGLPSGETVVVGVSGDAGNRNGAAAGRPSGPRGTGGVFIGHGG